jgi:hypothetical protein
MGISKIRFFIINKMKKSYFYLESAQGNPPNFIFRGSLYLMRGRLGFVHQHDRNAVLNRVAASTFRADDFLIFRVVLDVPPAGRAG